MGAKVVRNRHKIQKTQDFMTIRFDSQMVIVA